MAGAAPERQFVGPPQRVGFFVRLKAGEEIGDHLDHLFLQLHIRLTVVEPQIVAADQHRDDAPFVTADQHLRLDLNLDVIRRIGFGPVIIPYPPIGILALDRAGAAIEIVDRAVGGAAHADLVVAEVFVAVVMGNFQVHFLGHGGENHGLHPLAPGHPPRLGGVGFVAVLEVPPEQPASQVGAAPEQGRDLSRAHGFLGGIRHRARPPW